MKFIFSQHVRIYLFFYSSVTISKLWKFYVYTDVFKKKKKKDSGTYCLDMSWMILWRLLLLHIHSALTVGASPHHYYLSFSFTSSCQTKLGAQCLFLALAFHSHTSFSLTMVRMNNWKHFCIGYSWITADLYYLSFTLTLNTTLRKMCLFYNNLDKMKANMNAYHPATSTASRAYAL